MAQRIRCAIYTRKSSDDGLEQEFNSLHAQREACEAYIASQKHEGWVVLPEHYDDGGLSGGTLERPALQRLMDAVDEGLVDQIIVYKIDRLTRSLADFAKLVERLDEAEASFVSVTQSFNTATSMGRLTLNVLLSFAQFEREVTAERIRDKIAASKKKGLWMGGSVPLGYRAKGRTLEIDEAGAEIIRVLYRLYEQRGSITAVTAEANRLGLGPDSKRSRPDRRAAMWRADYSTSADIVVSTNTSASDAEVPTDPDAVFCAEAKTFERSHIHYILTNPTYAGRIRHKDKCYDGQHPAIIEPARWDRIQNSLRVSKARRSSARRPKGKQRSAPLLGKLFDDTNDRLTPHHVNKRGQHYRYYVSSRLLIKQASGNAASKSAGWRLPAPDLERRIALAIITHLEKALPRELGAVLEAHKLEAVLVTLRSETHLVDDRDEATIRRVLGLVHQANINRDTITIRLGDEGLAEILGTITDQLPATITTIETPFAIKRRGIEAKLIIGSVPEQHLDRTLLNNIAQGHEWYAALKAGASFDDLAKASSQSKQRMTQIMELAFLSPAIITAITRGEQPTGLTSDYLFRHRIPSDWAEQQTLIAAL